MVPRLCRYVLVEFTKVFLMTLSAMTAMMLILGVGKQAADSGIGPRQILQLLPFVLPESLRFTVPGTSLFAAASVYGRMSSSNEVVAVKALGIHPLAILWPVFVMAFLLSLVTVCVNDLAVSWGRHGVQRVIVEAVDEIAYGALRAEGSFSTPRLSILVKKVDGRKLIQPTVTFGTNDDPPQVTVRAREAELRTDVDAGVMVVSLTDGTVEIGDETRYRFPGTEEHVISLVDLHEGSDRSQYPSWMPLRRIPKEIAKQEMLLQDLKQRLAADTALDLLLGDFDSLASAKRQADRKYYDGEWNHYHRLQTEPFRRWANGFSCFCFVLVGAPLAIRLRNSDFLKSFFICFLPILVIYYPLLMFGVDASKRGSLPPYVVWLGNVILLAWGAALLRKVIRY